MIYEIDESCLHALAKNDIESVAFLEQLALDRRKCKNIVIAKREVLDRLSKMTCFSNVARNIYRALANRAAEYKLILKNTSTYCRLVDKIKVSLIVNEDKKEIIELEISDNAQKDFTGKTLMLAENEEDISFYKIIGQYYIRQHKIGNIKIDFEPQNGGGSTTCGVLKSIITNRNRMCLCIVDSDKKYGNAEPGETMRKVMGIVDGIQKDYFDVILLDVHEIENLLPLNVLDYIVKENNINSQAIEFISFLIDQDCSRTSPVFYFDLKKGIPRGAYFLEKNACDEEERKYRKLSNYREYWKPYIEKFGKKIEETNNPIISGVCDKTLKHALNYFNSIKKEGKIEDFTIEPYLDKTWLEIGEKVYCWGCVGGRIAI